MTLEALSPYSWSIVLQAACHPDLSLNASSGAPGSPKFSQFWHRSFRSKLCPHPPDSLQRSAVDFKTVVVGAMNASGA